MKVQSFLNASYIRIDGPYNSSVGTSASEKKKQLLRRLPNLRLLKNPLSHNFKQPILLLKPMKEPISQQGLVSF